MIEPSLLQFVIAHGVGDAAIRRLADFVAREGIALGHVPEMRAEELASALAISVDVAANVCAGRDGAVALADQLRARAIDVVWLLDAHYPNRLRDALGNGAPPVLFVKGNQALFRQKAVGFCGARKASENGLTVTEQAARILAREQICVISGYASGVDKTAHRAALESCGTTILVLAEGILRFHLTKAMEGLLDADNYLVVSQFPPWLPWIGRNAMRRNGTIIGLSDAMILVESGRDGGTFAAGIESLNRHQPLFVVDFEHPGPSAEANPFFIERGGIPIRANRNSRLPNLDRVLEVVRVPRGHNPERALSLF